MNRTGDPSVEVLLARIAALQAENHQLAGRVVKLEEELALARLHRFAPRSEKHVDRLFDEAEQAADEDDAGSETNNIAELPDTSLPPVENTTGKKRGRRPLPANLPRERVEYDLPEDQKACPCCRGHASHGRGYHRATSYRGEGEGFTERTLQICVPPLRSHRDQRPCRDRADADAAAAEQRCHGLNAGVLRWFINMSMARPLYRLAQAFERAGVPVSRGALGHWVIGSSEKHLSRIYDALKLRLRSQPLIHGDETTVQVFKEKDKEATSTSYMWAYRSGRDSREPIVLLDYQQGRGQLHPQTFLGDYHGILISDGYAAWRTLEGATHIGCMAHSRRRFVDALRARKKGGGPPEQALRFFDRLYRVERQARDGIPQKGETQADCIRRFRQQHSVPILNALKVWLDDMAPKVLPDSKLGDAVSYTRNQWGISDALHRRRQHAGRQQSSGARHQRFCNWQEELVVQRYRGRSQGQCRRLQPDADPPRLTRRAVSVVAPRPHRNASARRRRRYYRPAALQLPQSRHCLNGPVSPDTRAIHQAAGVDVRGKSRLRCSGALEDRRPR
ncbi:transposase [Bradyrhizobium sp. USDA 3364]